MIKHLPLAILCALFAADECTAAEAPSVTKIRAGKYRYTVSTDCPEHRAEVGRTVKLGIVVDSEESGFVRVSRFFGGIPQGEPEIIEIGERAEFTLTPQAPGSAALICEVLDREKQPVLNSRKRPYTVGIGALVSPEKIRPGNADEPADFDGFWKERRAELDKVPVRADRKEAELDAKYNRVVCYDVQVACSGGAPVSGYLCMPRDAKPKSLPALLMFHGAGVLSAHKHPEYAGHAIVFNVNAHGLPNGRSPAFYRKIGATTLKTYRVADLDDRHKIYFVGMFTRVMRALDYVKSLPEWDGKTLIVMGGSQGGGQALAAAALDGQVTLCCAHIPALCDLGGAKAGRRPGWPIHLPTNTRKWNDPKVIAETAYLDGVFFARRIKCPVYISTGLVDQTCVPPAVYSVYNSFTDGVDKHIEFNPRGGHGTVSFSKAGIAEVARQLGCPPEENSSKK